MTTLLHFADAHIDIANYGRHDPNTGLPLRVVDFLKSLDTIIEAAITERVDLVVFAGDAYKDRSPAPTFQREWERRIMMLSRAGIPTLLLVGNHDLSPSLGRAHAMEEFATLEIPHIRVVDKPALLKPEDLEGLPLQAICLPWISRSGMMAQLEIQAQDPAEIYTMLEERLDSLIDGWLDEVDPALPVLLVAHASVQGAKYGGERTVTLGREVVLPGSLVRDPRFDYVALGHIHKAQDLNDGHHPPVIYPGSIERVDFGEVGDEKFYIIAHVERGKTRVEWRRLDGIRPFVDRFIRLESKDTIQQDIFRALPPADQLQDAIVRLVLEYPRDWEPLIDDGSLRDYAAGAFEFHLVKRPQVDARIRLPEDQSIGSLTPVELLKIYWLRQHLAEDEIALLGKLAAEIIGQEDETGG
ncbi:MAG TPA: exonuclease SbcCD subunit D [Anaerolineales bacterium]|nr:exonuclease SbcCD subunit D [Anaerolineales bacterium]